MNKLDDFFKKAMEETKESPGGWNIPSELPWEQAKPFFPKPKRKRRFLIYLLFGLGISIISLTLILNHEKSNSKLKTDSNKIQNNERLAQESETAIVKPINEVTKEQQVLQADNAKNNIEEKPQSIHETKPVKDIIESKIQLQQKPNTELTPSPNPSNILSNKIVEKTSHKQIKSPALFQNNKSKDQNNKSINEEDVESVSQTLTQNSELKRLKFLGLKSLDRIWGTLEFDQDLGIEFPLKIEPVSRRKKWIEAGLSHKLGFFSFNRIQLKDEMDEIDLRSDYININFHVTKNLGKHWRISSGLSYSKVDANLKFKSFFNYDPSLLNQAVSNEVEAAGTIVKNENPEEININFLSGQQPEEGDLLNVQGALSLNWISVQMPIYVNYYWTRPKMEYYIGAGTHLRFFNITQSNVNAELFRDDLVIAEKPVIDDVDLKFVDIGLGFQTGFRRKITHNINLGLNAQVDFLNIIESGIDMGIYYRWN